MSDYKCKVRIIRDKEITVYAKNKNDAEKEAKISCRHGFGLPIDEHVEVLEMERMTAKKKAQERDEDGQNKCGECFWFTKTDNGYKTYDYYCKLHYTAELRYKDNIACCDFKERGSDGMEVGNE